MNLFLRKAIPEDAAKINALFIEMLNTVNSADDSSGYDEGYLEGFFTDGEDRIYVAERENEVVAFLSVEVYRAEGYLYLDDFSVTENYRNRGIGTGLLGMAEDYAEKNGISRLVLHVDKKNAAAYRFYQRHGFRDAADEGDRIRMEKRRT